MSHLIKETCAASDYRSYTCGRSVSQLSPKSREKLLFLPLHVVLVTVLLVLSSFYPRTWEVPDLYMYIAKQCVPPYINFSEREFAYEMRSDSFCSYTGVALVKKE